MDSEVRKTTKQTEDYKMTNLEKRDLSQKEAFAVYPKIEAAYELGNFEEAVRLNDLYESLVANANNWEQEQLKVSTQE
jgi:hypothetical protein